MTSTPEPLSRDELLAGLTGRRASTARYAIESRTAYLAQQARHAAAPVICAGLVARRERAFLAALAAGGRLPVRPAVQELERFAPRWAHLVPADPAVRAELARHLGVAHRFTRDHVPRLRAALDLDGVAVRAAYLRRHGHGLDAVYVPALTPRERLAWTRARWARRAAELPPFWAAFGLTLTETVGAGVLALPIALAGLGPLPGLAVVVVLGLVNVLTMAAAAEVHTRSGRVRFGGAYLSRVVSEFLGRPAAAVFGAAVVVFAVAATAVYYVGLAGVLAAGTDVPAPVWAAVLFAVVLGYLRRGSLDATVVSALAVGALSVLAVLVLSGVALVHLEPAHLLHARLPRLDGALLGPVFGVVLLAFFGHNAMAGCARVVLHREPTGRALAAGAASATLAATALYGLWVVAAGGAVPPARLAAEPGTALVPLAEVAGPGVLALGAVFAVPAMGMAAVHVSVGLHAQLREWLPGAPGRVAGAAAVTGMFVLAEVLLLGGADSFTGQLALLGTLTVPLLAGIFPMLLLLAARRRGEHVPALRLRPIGGPLVVATVCGLFLAGLLVHGLVLGDGWPARAVALVAAAVVGALVVAVVRGGGLRPRVVVEARRDTELGTVHLAVTAAGEPFAAVASARRGDGAPTPVAVPGELPAGTVAVTVALHGAPDRLVLRLHEVDPGGHSAPLAARARIVAGDDDAAPGWLGPHHGRVEYALPPGGASLELELPGEVPP